MSARPVAVDVSLVSSAHDVADGRLHRHCAAMTAAGLRVEVLCRGRAQDAPDGVRFRPLPDGPGVRGRVSRGLTGLVRARGRCAVVLDPELAAAGRLWSRVRGRPLVADVHEDYVAVVEDRAWATGPRKAVARRLARAATASAARATLTVVADEHVPPARARERLVVRNTVRAGEVVVAQERSPVPRAFYVGDVRGSRGFRTMVEAVEAAPPWELDVVGQVAPGEERWFRERGGCPRVRLHGRLSPTRSWAVGDGAWVGLSLLEDTPAFRAAVPTKLYEYLAHGLAVVVTPLPRSRSLVEESGAGVVAASAQEVSSTLRAWLAEPDRVDAHRARALEWARGRSLERSPFDRLAERLRVLVGSDTRES